MAATSTDSDQEWLQFVEEVQMSSPATSSGGDGGKLISLSATSSADHHHHHRDHELLSPNACISKPARRRPRAPRRTPATLLTADTANFRALVQKFTGRPAVAPFSSTSHRGPLTLNFELGTQQRIHPFGSDYHHHRRRHVEQQQQQPQPQQQQQPQFFPSDGPTITGDVLLSTIRSTDGQNSHGGFTMDNISLGPAGLNIDDNIGYFL